MKSTYKRGVAFAAALTVGLSLALSGCGSDSEGDQLSSEELAAKGGDINPQPRDAIADGGTFTTAIGEIPEQLLGVHADLSGDTVQLFRWYNPQMTLVSPEGEVTPNPDYLTDVSDEVVDGNRVVTYTIHPEAVFNDGTPLDYRAYEAMWKTHNAENTDYAVATTEGYSRITSVEPGENDKQAVVTYDGPWLWWQSQFKRILHPEVAKSPEVFNTAYTKDAHNEWGAGPFQVKELEPGGTSAVFERNPNWWGEAPKLETRVFRAMDITAQINAFRNGEIDAVEITSGEGMAQVKDMDGISIRTAAKTAVGFVHLNANSPKLGDVKVREAVQLGFDREVLQQIRYDGLNWDGAVPGSIAMYGFQDQYRDSYSEIGGGFDPERARELLDEAGWTEGDDGIREKDGQKLSLVYPIIGEEAARKNMGVALQAMLKDIGVELKLDFRSDDEFTNTYTNKDYDMFQLNWGTGDPDENFFSFCYFYCSDAGYVDQATIDEFSPRANEIGAIADKEEAIEQFMDLEEEILATWQDMPLYSSPSVFATKEKLANYGANGFYQGALASIGFEK